MYKVFVNDKPIILTSSLPKKEIYPIYLSEEVLIDELLHRLKTTDLQGVYIYSNCIEHAWKKFCNNFKVVLAAGGLVVNSKEEILFIFRGNKWDLPKGHMEKDETKEVTAIREVEEECGISNLTLKKYLIPTYHIYYQNKKLCLKETHWFLMNSNYSGELAPQLEEGITKAVFKKEEEIEKVLSNSYGNIKLVYQAYKK
ncbi:MAG: NUDIX domain-containing protein [Tenacibaculum sp.]|nr:NUDIX domain-containing protein [Tenacibaculum sp.]